MTTLLWKLNIDFPSTYFSVPNTQGTLIRGSWAKVDKTDEEDFFFKVTKKLEKTYFSVALLAIVQLLR